MAAVREQPDAGKWKYVELRPATQWETTAGLQSAETFAFHRLDLRPALQEIFEALTKIVFSEGSGAPNGKGCRAKRAGPTLCPSSSNGCTC
jgi:hypothetical protein